LLRAQATLPHEPGDAILAAALARLAQIELHARAAIGAPAALKALPDEPTQLRVTLTARPPGLVLMVVKAAEANAERRGEVGLGVMRAQGLHQLE
jgi:hypothetical protein